MMEQGSPESKMMKEGSTELFRYGTVDAGHQGGSDARVRLDGEDEAGVNGHAYVESYDPSTSPSANDRVMMMRHGKQWVILGKVV